MAGEPLARRDGGPEIIELGSVPGFVVFDLPGVPVSAGGTRLAPDVSVAEVALLARAMTYKFAALGQRVGGAKAGVRGNPADGAGGKRVGADLRLLQADDIRDGPLEPVHQPRQPGQHGVNVPGRDPHAALSAPPCSQLARR